MTFAFIKLFLHLKNKKMKVTNTILSALVLLVTITSCKKEKGQEAVQNALTGNWKFTSVSAITEATETYRESGINYKDVATSNYSSSAASGIYKISADMFNGENIAYTVNGSVLVKYYENNILDNSITFPFTYSLPSTSSTAKYKLIGSDSLYFESGSIVSPAIAGGTSQPSNAGGCKFKIEGSKMTITSNASKTSTRTEFGILITTAEKANATIVLQKQ